MMSLDPLRLYKCLSEETRLSIMLLLLQEGELCVCEMTAVLEVSQPKVSRHLA
ncbi:MAG: metalloregulator ArsR/SmtB family transcription factor, partial [Gammaproteobacteria bacterium]|nr:metalloregulator ArsR/SmtB family transcription factor [Gammaproteobacteria bacterium]